MVSTVCGSLRHPYTNSPGYPPPVALAEPFAYLFGTAYFIEHGKPAFLSAWSKTARSG